MRILIASDLHWPTINGVATFGRNLALALSEAGHEVLVIAPSQTGKKYKEVDQNHTIVRTAALPFPFYQNFRISVSPYSEVKGIIQEFQPDVIHIQTPLGIGRAAMGVGRKMGIPVVATNHAMPENLVDNLKMVAPFAKKPLNYILTELGARFYRNASYVTLPTEAAIKMFDEHDFEIPVVAVSNGIDLSRFSPGKEDKAFYQRFGIPTDKKIVSFVGRLDGEKHVSVMVHAIKRILEKMDVHGLIVGAGNDLENLQNLVKELGLQDKFTFTGRVEDEDMPRLHRVGTVFGMPSPAELQSIATLEAMASGQPVVAVNAGALYELCQDGRNGYLFETDNDEHMAEKLLSILSNDTLRATMSKESLAIAHEHDIAHTIQRFEQIYKEVIEYAKDHPVGEADIDFGEDE